MNKPRVVGGVLVVVVVAFGHLLSLEKREDVEAARAKHRNLTLEREKLLQAKQLTERHPGEWASLKAAWEAQQEDSVRAGNAASMPGRVEALARGAGLGSPRTERKQASATPGGPPRLVGLRLEAQGDLAAWAAFLEGSLVHRPRVGLVSLSLARSASPTYTGQCVVSWPSY